MDLKDCNWVDSSFSFQDVKKIFGNIQHNDGDDAEDDSGTEVKFSLIGEPVLAFEFLTFLCLFI